MMDVTPVVLPACFYLPRHTALGLEVRDVMPWDDAVSYVTDGERFGVHFRDGRVDWLIYPVGTELRAGCYAMDRERIPGQLRVEAPTDELVRAIWRTNRGVLERQGHPIGTDGAAA